MVGISKVTVQEMAKIFRGGRAGGRDPRCQDAFLHDLPWFISARARALMQTRRYRIDDASKAYKE